jgi:hypothetical protein
VHTNIITFVRSIRTDVRCHHIHSFGGLQSATYVPYHLRSSIRTDVRCHHILLLDCCFCFIITKGKYQQIFHFGPSLPGILTRPHRVLRYSPAVRGSNTAERGLGGYSCSWVAVCEAKPRRFLSFAPRRPGAGYIALSRRRGSALYTGHPLGHRSAWPACFQAGSLRRWRPPTFLFTSPSLKEDGENPQSRPSRIFWPACLPQAELANSTRPTRNNTIFSTRTGMPWFIRGSSLLPS